MNIRQVCVSATAACLLTFTTIAFGPTLIASPHTAAQAATTHRTVSAATMSWGVRESFRKYIETGVAKGTITTGGGASRSGNTFQFPLDSSTISSTASGQITFAGEVHFTGHNGALDMLLRNPTVVIDGTQGELRVDYISRKFEGMDATGTVREGRQETLATIALAQAPDFSAAHTTISGTVSLTSSGAEIFGGFYEAGEALDPLNIELSLGDGAGGTATANRSKTPTGAAGLLAEVNDTLIEVNGLLVNTENLLKSGDSLYNRVNPAPPTPAAPAAAAVAPVAASAVPPAPAAPVASGRSGVAAPLKTTGNTPTAGTPGSTGASGGSPAGNGAATNGSADGVCAAATSRGVTSAEARWGVRQSFRTYIRGNIAKGAWELTSVGDDGSGFTFNGNAGAVDTAARSGSILFPGTIRFTGHGGVLDTRFSNMEIQFNGNSGQIILNASSNSTEGKANDFGRIAIANLSFTDLNITDSAASGTATASLTDVGAEAFGQFYPPGDPLDPISFNAQLGGTANCAQGQGSANMGAATGKGGLASDAAKLRSGGSDAQAKLGTSVTGSNSPAAGSVFDNVEDAETVASAQQPEGGKFQIKNVAGDDPSAIGGWDDATISKLLLLAASLIGAGGALTRFAMTA